MLNAKKSDDNLYEKLVDEKLKILKEIVENGGEDEEILNEIDKTMKEKEELIESRRQEEIYYLEKRIKTIDEELPNAIKYNGDKYVCMLFDSKIKLLKEIVENGGEDEEILNEIDKTIKEKENFLERRK